MIAKDLLPWLFVKRGAGWTPYAKIRADGPRPAARPAESRVPRRAARRAAVG